MEVFGSVKDADGKVTSAGKLRKNAAEQGKLTKIQTWRKAGSSPYHLLSSTRIMASGYIYVLANSSMPGLVKVGRTTRSASARAQELSNVTGMPVPFIVVYEQFFADCDSAELFVHEELARHGTRVSENREFFQAAIPDVIKAIVRCAEILPTQMQVFGDHDDLCTTDPTGFDDFGLQSRPASQPWDTIMDEADNHYFGHTNYLQDYSEARRLFSVGARLGCPLAYERLAGC